MIKKWLGNILPKKRKNNAPECVRHPITLDIPSHATEQVLQRLQRAGFEAYLVGGAVRDMLLGIEPKDFDVATNATPEEVHKLFRRSRIIGRRFQIVHVMIGSETIEVSTFRSGGKVCQNEHGRIMQDNAYGTLEQDVLRRDFTCNALYYDQQTHEVIDYHHGVADIQAKKLVIIGQPAERYLEDPVRILRAVRLAGKLGFEVEKQTAEPIAHYADLLKKEPVARLFDELLKILLSGYAAGCLKQLETLGIRSHIHPLLDAMQQAAQQNEQHIATRALKQTDQRLRAGKSISVGFILATMLWSELEKRWQRAQQNGQSPAAAINSAINALRDDMEKGWGVPQRYSATMREIWVLQPQFEHRRGARPYRLLSQARFRAAYDFLLLRADADSSLKELAQWWTEFQHADEARREEMTRNAPTASSDNKKKRRRKPRKKKSSKVQE
ncbi:polynucleotide adenylyltransferase PcnB [Neisseriaceae bacterium B1]